MRGIVSLTLFAILQFCMTGFQAYGQTSDDDSAMPTSQQNGFQQAAGKADSVRLSVLSKNDSLTNKLNVHQNKLDSVKNKVTNNRHVSAAHNSIDSLQNVFNHRTDSLQKKYQARLSKIDSSQTLLRKKLDSLTTRRLPTASVKQKLDSLDRLKATTIQSAEKKLQAIKDNTLSKLEKLDLPPEAKEKLNSVTKNMNGINIQSPTWKIPVLKNGIEPLGGLEQAHVPNGMPNVSLPGKEIPAVDIPNGINGTSMGEVAGTKSEVLGVKNQVDAYSKEAGQLAKGNVDGAENLSKKAEEKAVQASGIENVKQESAELEELKALKTKAQDPEAVKKEAVEKTKQVAVNHFAGKEEQLKSAMEKMSKYKQKYSSMEGIKDLSKKRPNEMRDKPFFERVVPGIALQLQRRGDDLLVDFNPYAGYRFTGRLRAGIGWNQRIGYNTAPNAFNPNARIFGPRTFAEFKLGKGFSPRAEIEIMNTTVPSLTTTLDPNHREWVWGAFAGMKKEYKLFKNVKGTAMVMARLYNPNHKSPYADVVNVRFGFEFPMKKKVKAKKV